eukprot:124676-Rhodomonas_salina.7
MMRFRLMFSCSTPTMELKAESMRSSTSENCPFRFPRAFTMPIALPLVLIGQYIDPRCTRTGSTTRCVSTVMRTQCA